MVEPSSLRSGRSLSHSKLSTLLVALKLILTYSPMSKLPVVVRVKPFSEPSIAWVASWLPPMTRYRVVVPGVPAGMICRVWSVSTSRKLGV